MSSLSFRKISAVLCAVLCAALLLVMILTLLTMQSARATTNSPVLSYLYSISGAKTVSGQHNREPNSNPISWTNWIYSVTGEYPGLWGGDFLYLTADVEHRGTMINEAKNQWNHGALVTLMWHVCPPTITQISCDWKDINSDLTDDQWAELVTYSTTTTSLNYKWRKRIDEIVPYLEDLKNNGVEVLWRPLHEMNDDWCWWCGRPGPEGSLKLYQITYNYMTYEKGLTNLIWVWNVKDVTTTLTPTLEYYPGDNYVDVVSLDPWNDWSFPIENYSMTLAIANGKPIAIGETGKLPSPSVLAAQPRWTWFLGWAELVKKNNTVAQIREVYNDPRAVNRGDITLSVGISFDLHGFDASLNADWGSWCETGTIGSNAACADYGLLSSSFVTTMTHRGDSGVSLKLSYVVTQTDTLASYYEHLYYGGIYTDPFTYIDLSSTGEFRFWVKGEGNTISDTTRFYVRFSDKDWHTGFYTITGVSGDWQEKKIDLESLKNIPDWQDINWHQMREITIIFENNQDGSGRVANPLTGTLYLDLIGLTSPDSDPTFPDPLNNFIADWGSWCETDTIRSNAACDDYGLLSSNVVTVPHYGNSGASLKLSYAVTQTNTLASHYEHLYNGNTFYDLSSMGEFRLWVKGEGSTIGDNTTFLVRFADKDWHTGFYTITGVSGYWQEKKIDLESLKNTPGWQDINWHQMREFTIIFENNRDGSGRVANPLTGTLYFDDLAFVDVETSADTDDQFLELLERRAFQYFWEYADPTTGLIRETAAEPNMSSIAAVGFGLTSICAAEERGWITHDEAYTRVLTTLDSFYDDPNDPNDFVVSGTHGLFYHFVNIRDGTPMFTDLDGVSTIDTALLMAGVLSVKQCFTETEIITRATAIYEAADWNWFLDQNSGLLTMCWTPQDEYPYQCWTTEEQRDDDRVWRWAGYNEAMILYLLAIGSPSHPISATSWISWANTYQWGAYYGYPVLVHAPSPLFGHQYSHAWVDFRDQKDDYANYFRNSRYATLAHRAYSLDVWYPDRDLWGTTSSHGPIAGTCSGRTYRVIGYPPDWGNNDGTIAPTAAGGSIVFTPQESISTLRYMYDYYHQGVWGLYGLKGSLNARCEPDWFDNDYIGIDVGAMLLMIENYRSGLVWDIFMQNQEITQAMEAVGFTPDQTKEPSWFYYREAEQYDDISGVGVGIEEHSKAWVGKTLQIDPGPEPNPGNQAVYTFTVDQAITSGVFFEVRYSDDVAGDVIDVYLDDARMGSFTTDEFEPGGWEAFDWDYEQIYLGMITSGVHTVTLQVAEGNESGLYGANLDVFKLYTPPCRIDSGMEPFSGAGYCFVKGLIHPNTGLVRSREGECFTTVYKNSLAAMTFIHQGDVAEAERIFDFFQVQLTTPFTGFVQAWDACTGTPDDNSDHWEGDNAFLLLALNHYAQETGSYGNYETLAYALKDWLMERADSCGEIVAEGVANMYAALAPFGSEWETWKALSKLHRCFYDSVDYPGVADHTVRGALVFGDTTGFDYLSNFERTEDWCCNGESITASAAFSTESFINVEISAQLLLAWRIWQDELGADLSSLRPELEKLRLSSQQNPTTCAGLPYLVTHPITGGFRGDCYLPIVDSTIYLLFDEWDFNPFAPGKTCAGCHHSQFISLKTEGQEQGFPRLFVIGQDFEDFPQEINGYNHENIVISFTAPTTPSLFAVPLTLTIDTVARGDFTLTVKLDNSDHCLADFEPITTSGPITSETTVILLSQSTSAPPAQTYQLVLEGEDGWGVFDWLQLEIPDQVLWTIGYDDDRCCEFDNNGFTYLCSGLSVTKEAHPAVVQAGAQLTYTIYVTNTGNVPLTVTVTDTLPDHVTPTGTVILTSGAYIASDGVWAETIVVTVEMGYAGPLTNVVQVTTVEGATGVYTETSQAVVTPDLIISKQAYPDPVEAGAQLTYTICVTNTGNVDLHATITDILPVHVTPGSMHVWTATIPTPSGVWTKQFTTTAEMGYSGTLTNVVQVTTKESATGTYMHTVSVEEPISGLSAVNDGPTVLGNVTTLTATVEMGSNVTYTWALGDGGTGSEPVVTHTYSTAGVYTAVVTASNSVSVVTATTTVTIELHHIYLPVVLNCYNPCGVCKSSGQGNTEIITFTSSSCLAAEIRIDLSTRKLQQYGFSLREVEAYGPDAGMTDNLLTGGTACASSVEGNECLYYGPRLAIDGFISTRWSSDFDEPQWLVIILPEPQVVKKESIALRREMTLILICPPHRGEISFRWCHQRSREGPCSQRFQVGGRRQPATANGADCLLSLSTYSVGQRKAAACTRRRPPCLSAINSLHSSILDRSSTT